MSDGNTGGAVTGLVHQAAIYRTDEEFLAMIGPFLRQGVAAGEPTFVAVGHREVGLLRAAMGDLDGVSFLPHDGYLNPLRALKANRELLAASVGAGSARLLGQIPQQQLVANWHGWVRYEAAVAHVLGALPVQALCAYDARHTPAGVLEDVERTHPCLAAAGGHPRANEQFADPVALLTERMRGEPDPLERGAAAIELTEPSAAAARVAVATCAGRTRLGEADVEGLVLAVSEVVTNAHRHGRPGVTLRAWAAADRVIVTVTDGGTGPGTPFAGLAPATGEARTSGFGLWISHQVCSRVDHIQSADGFTVRLVATGR